MKKSKTHGTNAIEAFLIIAMFVIWGLSHRLYDTVLPGFVAALSLSEFQVSVAHVLNSLGYCLIAIPAAFFLRNVGYKAGVVGGLGCFAIGMFMFYPADTQHSYAFFLGAGLLASCGVALLEIAADPWVMRIGPVETAIRRLNVAQTFNPIGLLIGMYVGTRLVSAAPAHQAGHLIHPFQPYIFVGTGVLLFAYLMDKVQFSPVATERVQNDDNTFDDIRKLMKRPAFLLGLGALVLYIAGQSVLWGFGVRYASTVEHTLSATAAADLMEWSLYAFILGRVVGTALMYKIDPIRLLAVFSAAAAALTATAAFVQGWNGIWCIVGASFFLSILFPTIFGHTVQYLGKHTKSASALLIMASGSANVALPIMNLLCGAKAPPYIVLLPAICFSLITAYALMQRKKPENATPQTSID